MGKTKYMKLQAVYSVAELAHALSISNGRTARLLSNAGITAKVYGNQRLVLVSEIENQMPGLWASVVACERARAISRALEGSSLGRKST